MFEKSIQIVEEGGENNLRFHNLRFNMGWLVVRECLDVR